LVLVAIKLGIPRTCGDIVANRNKVPTDLAETKTCHCDSCDMSTSVTETLHTVAWEAYLLGLCCFT
jgi:hypothetical protein